MNRVTVHLDEKPIYDIVMTEDFSALPGEIEKLSISNRRLCIVTDSNVEKLYLNEVKELLAPCCKTVRSVCRRFGRRHRKAGCGAFSPVQRPFAARRCTDCGWLLRQWSVRLLLGACIKYVLDSRVLQSACEKWHTEYGLAFVVVCMLLHPYVSGRTLSV